MTNNYNIRYTTGVDITRDHVILHARETEGGKSYSVEIIDVGGRGHYCAQSVYGDEAGWPGAEIGYDIVHSYSDDMIAAMFSVRSALADKSARYRVAIEDRITHLQAEVPTSLMTGEALKDVVSGLVALYPEGAFSVAGRAYDYDWMAEMGDDEAAPYISIAPREADRDRLWDMALHLAGRGIVASWISDEAYRPVLSINL